MLYENEDRDHENRDHENCDHENNDHEDNNEILMVLTASIAEVVSIAVSPPERGRSRPTVHTLPTLCEKDKSQFFGILASSIDVY